MEGVDGREEGISKDCRWLARRVLVDGSKKREEV